MSQLPINTEPNVAIEMRRISKSFPGVLANDKVDLTVHRGEIHGLVGENGAGKSTLMNILAGVQAPDEGTITVLGRERQFRSAAEAIHASIGMVHQHFMLVPSFTVLDNLILGLEPVRFGGILKRTEARSRVLELAERHGFPVKPDAIVGSLPVVMQQQAEILKCLLQGSQVMIFDEPTSVLAPQETEALLATLRELASSGRTILLITHKLREVMAVCDHVTVLRDGRVTGTLSTTEATEQGLARLMVGRDVQLPIRSSGIAARLDATSQDRAAVLEITGLKMERSGGNRAAGLKSQDGPGAGSASVSGNRNKQLLGPIDLNVKAGEIVGVAAIAGNGQAELVEAIVGLTDVADGTIRFSGQDVTRLGVRRRRESGLAYIPQDRRGRGTAPTRTVLQNAIAARYRTPELQRWGWLSLKAATDLAERLVKRFDVRTTGVGTTGLSLSGGNLQKLVVGRELETEPNLLIAEDPTQGIDIGSVEAVRGHLLRAAELGCGILLVSQDLSEVLALSDRVLVLYEGRIVGEKLPGPEAEQAIGLLMTGAVAT